eukprot:s11_g10.t1
MHLLNISLFQYLVQAQYQQRVACSYTLQSLQACLLKVWGKLRVPMKVHAGRIEVWAVLDSSIIRFVGQPAT